MKPLEENKEDTIVEKEQQATENAPKKQWIGKGIYGKKDVPIRILDGMIGVFAIMIITLIVVFAINGGYYVTFDTDGGSEVAKQKLSHGDLVEQPEVPVKPGYDFVHWVTSEDEYLAEVWDFDAYKIETDTTLYAVWQPAEMAVKFDTDGGRFKETENPVEKTVTFGECYGELPVPVKDGYRFDGWVYSQQIISEDTIVFMTGEHILTARWISE